LIPSGTRLPVRLPPAPLRGSRRTKRVGVGNCHTIAPRPNFPAAPAMKGRAAGRSLFGLGEPLTRSRAERRSEGFVDGTARAARPLDYRVADGDALIGRSQPRDIRCERSSQIS